MLDAVTLYGSARRRRWLAAAAIMAVGGAGVWHALSAPAPMVSSEEIEAITRTVDIYSEVFTVDQTYRSMRGPMSEARGALSDADPPELLWITGYRAVMVDGESEAPVSQEFMCHANLDLDMPAHRKRFGWEKNASRRLFTLSQGQNAVRFPPGFGIPIASDEEIEVQMQVLNLNEEGPPFTVRHKVTVEYVRDRDLAAPMQPLFMKAAAGLVSLDDARTHYCVVDAYREEHGEGCMPGERAAGNVTQDRHGQRFSGHWVVRPGHEENHTLVTQWLRLPFDTTVHYVAAHVHPFAKSIELRDLTDGRTVFRSNAHNFEDRIGLREVEHYSSREGFKLYADHEYELVSIYDNTSGEDQDSMAVLFLYLLDREFERPEDLAGS
jgi:hypothetical protein